MPNEVKLQPVSLQPPGGYIFSCMANRFYLEKNEGFTLAHFGLLDDKNLVVDRFSCVFSDETLQLQKDNLVNYLDKLTPSKKEIPSWTPPTRDDEKASLSSLMNFSVVDFIHMSSGEAYGELCFWNYSQGTVADKIATNQKAEIQAWGVGMIRCSIALQRAFIESLYAH